MGIILVEILELTEIRNFSFKKKSEINQTDYFVNPLQNALNKINMSNFYLHDLIHERHIQMHMDILSFEEQLNFLYI